MRNLRVWEFIGGSIAILAIFAATLWAIPAKAADKGQPSFLEVPTATPAAPWSGVYLGLHAGYGIGNIELAAGGGSIDGLSAHGAIGGFHGGLDYQVPGGPLVVRVRGAYTWGDVEFNITDLVNASIRDGWSVDGGLGYAMGSAMPYVFAGYTKVKTETSFFGHSVDSPDLEGMRVGAGVEWRIPGVPNATLAAEYTFTDYDDLKFGPITLDADDHRVMGKVNFRLGGGQVLK